MKRAREEDENEDTGVQTGKRPRLGPVPTEFHHLIDDVIPLITGAFGKQAAPLLAWPVSLTCKRMHTLLRTHLALPFIDHCFRHARFPRRPGARNMLMWLGAQGAWRPMLPPDAAPAFVRVVCGLAAAYFGNVEHVLAVIDCYGTADSLAKLFAFAVAGRQPRVVQALIQFYSPPYSFPLACDSDGKLIGPPFIRNDKQDVLWKLIPDTAEDGLGLVLRVISPAAIPLGALLDSGRFDLLESPAIWPLFENRSRRSLGDCDFIGMRPADLPHWIRLFDYPRVMEALWSGDLKWLWYLTDCVEANRPEVASSAQFMSVYLKAPHSQRRTDDGAGMTVGRFYAHVVLRWRDCESWLIIADCCDWSDQTVLDVEEDDDEDFEPYRVMKDDYVEDGECALFHHLSLGPSEGGDPIAGLRHLAQYVRFLIGLFDALESMDTGVIKRRLTPAELEVISAAVASLHDPSMMTRECRDMHKRLLRKLHGEDGSFTQDITHEVDCVQ